MSLPERHCKFGVDNSFFTAQALDMVSCWPLGCANNSERGFRLYPFPKDPDLRSRWLVTAQRANPTEPHKLLQPTTSSKICQICIYCMTMMLSVWTDLHLYMNKLYRPMKIMEFTRPVTYRVSPVSRD